MCACARIKEHVALVALALLCAFATYVIMFYRLEDISVSNAFIAVVAPLLKFQLVFPAVMHLPYVAGQ